MAKQEKEKALDNIKNEIFIALIGGLGIDFDKVACYLKCELKKAGYHSENIKVSDYFKVPKKFEKDPFEEYYAKMQIGSLKRKKHGKEHWAKKVIRDISGNKRIELSKSNHKKIAYVIRSIKTKEELDLLSNVYGRNLISISIFSEEDKRKAAVTKMLKDSTIEKTNELLSSCKKINKGLDSKNKINDKEKYDKYDKGKEQFLIEKDREETHPELQEYGQNLDKCYSHANYFLYQDKNLDKQVARLVRLIFGYPFAEPTVDEYFMFCAQATAYRSLDLDRQVGAVIANEDNELIASGFNDVSKVGGGHFSHHDHPLNETISKQKDFRDFKQQDGDFNHNKLDKLAEEIYLLIKMKEKRKAKDNKTYLIRKKLRGITEYKRSTHGEMSALLDAARRGVSVKGATIYINTYPCHNCMKHIIAVGIRKVVYLHPYSKSESENMYKGMIFHGIENLNKEKVLLQPFLGVSPNRYVYVFDNSKDTRQGDDTGKRKDWILDKNKIPKDLKKRNPHTYFTRERASISCNAVEYKLSQLYKNK